MGGNIFFSTEKDDEGRFLPDTTEEILTQNFFKLVINPASDSSAFIFHWANRIDTLEVTYAREIAVVTPDCGFDQRIDNLQIIKNYRNTINKNFKISRVIVLRKR